MKVFYRISIMFVFFFLAIISQAISSPDRTEISSNLVNLLGTKSEGTEFYLTFHPCWEESFEPINKIYIYVASSEQTIVTLEIPGKDVFQEKVCEAFGVVVFELKPSLAQCYERTSTDAPSPVLEYPGYGIIIRSEKPVICYGLNTSQTTSEGFLAIPKSSLGQSYIVSSYNSAVTEETNQYLTSYTSVVGVYPETDVEICVGGSKTNYTEKPSDLHIGSIEKITLQKGDVFLLGVKGEFNDLTGTTIEATKPVAVISGSYATNVPKEINYCGYLIEQEIPVKSWGTEYQVIPIKGRAKPSIVRVMASKPNTKIYLNGNEWAVVETRGGVTGKAFIERRAVVDGGTDIPPINISAWDPIAVTQFNPGFEDDNLSSAPFQMSLTPVEQYLNNISFIIPSKSGTPVYNFNYINICYKTNDIKIIPEDIEFGQSDGTTVNWKKLANIAQFPTVIKDEKVPSGEYWMTTTLELTSPAYGYYLKGNNKMMAYCYGLSARGVYAYPAMLGLKDISKADVKKPSALIKLDCEGNISGTITDEPKNDVELRTNLQNVQLIEEQSSNISVFDSTEEIFINGMSSKWDFSLKVIDKTQKAKAVIYASDCAGNDTTYTIEYYPVKFALDKNYIDFGAKTTHSSKSSKTCELTNKSEKPIVLDSICMKSKYNTSNEKFVGFSINNSIYKENGGKLPGFLLNPGEKISFDVSFDPSSVANDVNNGKKVFIDSINIKANWSEGTSEYCFDKNLVHVIGNIKTSDLLPPKPVYTVCCCGNSAGGYVFDEPKNDPVNRSHLSQIRLNSAQSINCANVEYDKDKLATGTSDSLNWEVNTIDIEQDGKAVIVFQDYAGNDTTITINLIKTKFSFAENKVDFGKIKPDSQYEIRELSLRNASNKDVILDSIQLISNDKTKVLPKSGFQIDPSVYKGNGGKLPNLTLTPNEEFRFNVIFDPQSIQDQITAGQTEFRDSIGLKANWNADLNIYCYSRYLPVVLAEISSASVYDESESIKIVPNPASDVITFKMGVINPSLKLVVDEVSIYNTLGEKVMSVLQTPSSELNSEQTGAFVLPLLRINISDLPRGIYFVKAGNEFVKFVKM